jgi:hypothetical protein
MKISKKNNKFHLINRPKMMMKNKKAFQKKTKSNKIFNNKIKRMLKINRKIQTKKKKYDMTISCSHD